MEGQKRSCFADTCVDVQRALVSRELLQIRPSLYNSNGYSDGQAYTEQEYFDWLDEAGFIDFERVAMPDGGSIVTARKPV